jgi:hypothetical protein
MPEGKGQFKFFLVFSLVLFVTGLALGYYWEYKRQQQTDYKDMLRKTITYITNLEEQKQEIDKKVITLQNDLSNLQKQQGTPGNDQLARLNERLAVLEKENADLKVKAAQSEALAQENQQLRQQRQNLVESMNSSAQPPKAQSNMPVQGTQAH